jgi:hypothetical protein
MSRIRPQVNPNQPIPNNPFYSDLNPYVQGPYFPFVAGAGVDLNSSGIPQIQNDVAAVLAAGSGITLSTTGGVTTISSSGGGGSGTVTSVTGTAPIQVATGTTTPVVSIDASTPTTIGAISGYTDVTDTDFNTSLGYCALGVGGGSASGFANVAIGLCAGCAVTTAYGNTLIGPGTGIAIDTGNTNTALGIGALSLTTSGFANLGVGMCSGCAFTTESGNAVFGGYFGDAGDTNTLALADGAGNLKAKFDSLGALSFNGTNYGTAGQVLLSNGAGAKPTWGATGMPGWTDAGAMTIGATVTPPPFGNVGTNKIYYRQLGNTEYEVIYILRQGAPAGSSGSGDYLFTLPAGLQFNTTLPFQTAVTFAGPNSTWPGQVIVGHSLSRYLNGSGDAGVVQPLVYDATRFRLIGVSQTVSGATITPTYNAIGSSFFPLSSGFGTFINVRFQFTST